MMSERKASNRKPGLAPDKQVSPRLNLLVPDQTSPRRPICVRGFEMKLRSVVVIVVLATFSIGLFASERNDNSLIEYGYGSLSDGSFPSLMLWPPVVKIYQDGVVVFADKAKYWEGCLPEERLDTLRNALRKNKALTKSAFDPTIEGSIINIHGGLVYVRYLCGNQEVLLTTVVFPKKGPLAAIISLISRVHSPGSSWVLSRRNGLQRLHRRKCTHPEAEAARFRMAIFRNEITGITGNERERICWHRL